MSAHVSPKFNLFWHCNPHPYPQPQKACGICVFLLCFPHVSLWAYYVSESIDSALRIADKGPFVALTLKVRNYKKVILYGMGFWPTMPAPKGALSMHSSKHCWMHMLISVWLFVKPNATDNKTGKALSFLLCSWPFQESFPFLSGR